MPHKILNSDVTLPQPSAVEVERSQALVDVITANIQQSGGVISFNEYFNQIMYQPSYGYYVAGKNKLGARGDFITAPEISPLFGRALAQQVAQLLQVLSDGVIFELGAGRGLLAADLLLSLEALNQLPNAYWILEVSPDLRSAQQATILERAPHLYRRVVWLDHAPMDDYVGIVIGNEVIDALSCHRFVKQDRDIVELGVGLGEGGRFIEQSMSVPSLGLVEAVLAIESEYGPLQSGYQSEVRLQIKPWLDSLTSTMVQGAMIWVDYGYLDDEFYHPSRRAGTLSCYYRHHLHHDPYVYPGLQDVTAHVDFGAVMSAADQLGFEISGFGEQAYFLYDCGIETWLGDHVNTASVRQLLQPDQMGSQFKVLGLSRNLDMNWIGFKS